MMHGLFQSSKYALSLGVSDRKILRYIVNISFRELIPEVYQSVYE